MSAHTCEPDDTDADDCKACVAAREEHPPHSPTAWRNCEICRDAEGDMRQHDD